MKIRRTLVLCGTAIAFGVSCFVPTSQTVARGGGPQSAFLGASAGVAVGFDSLTLPEVVEGPFNDPSGLSPFEPAFASLTTGNTVIQNAEQAKRIWRRLFKSTFDTASVDFDSEFVVLVGAGKLANGGIEVTAVEQFEATFEDPMWFGGETIEPKLAVVATVTLGGAQPDPDLFPPVYRLAAVKINRSVEADIMFHRAVVALP